MLKFVYSYLRSMRLYYGFVTGTTTLVGCLASGQTLTEGRTWLLFAMGFLAWGFNQIFSDWCDRKEDAINAPHRPMVTGALKPAPAFAVSALGLVAIAVVGFLLSPWTLIFLGIGGALNIAYSLLKRVPVLNCLVYACAISCCAAFGWVGATGNIPSGMLYKQLALWVVPVHFLMCHNSYYKDVEGDRAAGVRTLQTICPTAAATLSVVLMIIPVVALKLVARWQGWSGMPWLALCLIVGLLSALFLLALKTGRYHRATNFNCQLCVALLHLQFFPLSWPVCLVSLGAVNLLFLWYRDEKE